MVSRADQDDHFSEGIARILATLATELISTSLNPLLRQDMRAYIRKALGPLRALRPVVVWTEKASRPIWTQKRQLKLDRLCCVTVFSHALYGTCSTWRSTTAALVLLRVRYGVILALLPADSRTMGAVSATVAVESMPA